MEMALKIRLGARLFPNTPNTYVLTKKEKIDCPLFLCLLLVYIEGKNALKKGD
jgi:hypothetical protein